MSKKYILLFTIMWLAFQPFENTNAALRTKARICSVKGTVQTGAVSEGLCPLKRTMNQTECRVVNQKTMIETGPDGYATVEYMDGRKVKIKPDTKVILERDVIYIESGGSWFKVEKSSHNKQEWIIKTPTAIAGIRGTEFVVNVKKDGSTNIQLIEGSIEVSDAKKKSKIMLAAGMEVTIPKGSSTLNTGLLNIKENDKWWTDWPTLIPIANMPGYTGGTSTSSNDGNTFSPIADNHVYAYSYRNWNRANWGKYEALGAGWNPIGGEKRTYLKFDLTGIDPNSVNKATLKLYHYHTGGSNSVELGVYRVMSPWQEGNDTYHSGQTENSAAPGELSWVNQPGIDQYPVVYFNPGQGTNKWIEVDVTSLVKAWLTGIPNHGMAIKAGENYIGGSESQYGFHSREYKDADKRPHLVINGIVSQQTNGQNIANNVNSVIPKIDGEWEITCFGDITYKFNLKLVQSGNGFYGDMVRTNGNEKLAKIEGRILSNDRIEFTRSIGNWKQYYTGEINQKSGSRATSFEGMYGFKDQLNYEWYAKAINGSNQGSIQQNLVSRPWVIGTDNGIHYGTGSGWTQQAGGGKGKDIAIDGNDRPWVIGTDNGIHYHNGSRWVQYPGGGKGSAIAVSQDGTPWVIGTDNGIYYGTGSSWAEKPGGGRGKDIAIDGNGRPWVIGTDNGIYYHNGSRWVQYPGGGRGLALAVASDGTPWVIGTNNHIFHGTGSGWVEQSGGGIGKDIAIDGNGRPWVIGQYNGIHYHDGNRWVQYPGGGRGLAINIASNRTSTINTTSSYSLSGQWIINQHNGFNGTFNLQQDQSGRITGTATWDRHESGTIAGQISGNTIEFTISYPSGIQGFYKGTLTQNGIKIINGNVRANNGATSTWDASKVATVSSIAGQWLIDQHNGYNGTLKLQQTQSGRFTGTATWDRYESGTIDGKISGNSIEFTISYSGGVKGFYKGTLTQDGTMITNGTVKANNGASSTWSANK